MSCTLSVFRQRLTIASAALVTVAGSLLSHSAQAAPIGAQAAPIGNYHEVARYPVGGEGGWDYLIYDSIAHRLYITRSSHVQVVDSETGKLVGDILNTNRCHGVALIPKRKRGFISNGGDNTVTIFDTDTLKTVGTVPVGSRPDAILYDPATDRVFTFNGSSNDATVLDAATGKVVGTIPLGGKPEFAVSDGKGKVYVNIEDKSELLTIDPKALRVTKTTMLAPAEAPSGLALDAKTHTLYAACDNDKAAIVDGNTGKLLATPAIGAGPDAAIFDPGTKLAFTSNGEDGTLTMIQKTGAQTFSTKSIPGQVGGRTMTLDPVTHRLFVVTAKFEEATPGATKARPKMLPDSFVVIVYGLDK